MGLTALLVRVAAARPHVLVVAVPGGDGARLAVEAEVAQRGWPAALSPADADVFVVAGVAGQELSPVVDEVWRQVPAPRARADVLDAAGAARALDAAAILLADPDHQRVHAPRSADPPEEPAMADLGDDRDGLRLDRLHVPLGPVLPDWPPGLVLRVTLQGDVVQEAAATVLDARSGDGFWAAQHPAVRELDGLARFLGVAGWTSAAAWARRVRDDLVAGGPAQEGVRLLDRVGRSRALRWSVRGIPVGARDVGDVLGERLAAVRSALAGAPPSMVRPGVAELPALLVGTELAAARLIVAALDPEAAPAEVPDG